VINITHDVATEHWRILQDDRRQCFTSNYVLDEAITLLARRSTYDFAAERARNLFESASLSILRPDANDELAALGLFKKYADQSVSFTDCISFVLMVIRIGPQKPVTSNDSVARRYAEQHYV